MVVLDAFGDLGAQGVEVVVVLLLSSTERVGGSVAIATAQLSAVIGHPLSVMANLIGVIVICTPFQPTFLGVGIFGTRIICKGSESDSSGFNIGNSQTIITEIISLTAVASP